MRKTARPALEALEGREVPALAAGELPPGVVVNVLVIDRTQADVLGANAATPGVVSVGGDAAFVAPAWLLPPTAQLWVMTPDGKPLREAYAADINSGVPLAMGFYRKDDAAYLPGGSRFNQDYGSWAYNMNTPLDQAKMADILFDHSFATTPYAPWYPGYYYSPGVVQSR